MLRRAVCQHGRTRAQEIGDAEQSYLDGLAEVEILLKDSEADQDALAMKQELQAGLAALRADTGGATGTGSHPLVIGPAPPPASAAAPDADGDRPAKRQKVASAGHGTATNKNARMHPGTGYADQEPDFVALVASDAALAPHVCIRPDGRWALTITPQNCDHVLGSRDACALNEFTEL